MTNKSKDPIVVDLKSILRAKASKTGCNTCTYNGKKYTIAPNGEFYSDEPEDLLLPESLDDSDMT